MISRKHGCLFIHIPKCAGTSIEKSLGMHADGLQRSAQDHRRFVTLQRSVWPPQRGKLSPVAFAHFFKQRAIAAQRRFDCPSDREINSFFKFSIVRNPWARAHSWYRNVIRDPVHRRTFNVTENCGLDEFLQQHLDCWALDPQLDWLTDETGKLQMDYVGKFEELESSFAEVQRRLGQNLPALENMLVSGSVNYRKAYSDALAERVLHKYRAEIEMFGYEF